jgi:hypothetical protein
MPKLICPACGNEKLVVELRKKPCPKCGTKMVPADTKPKMPQVVLTHDEGAKIPAAGGQAGATNPGGPKVKAPGGPKVKAPGVNGPQTAADATPEGKKE